MQYKDLNLHSDENVYENAEMFTVRRQPNITVDAIELQTTEEEYEQIDCVNRKSDSIIVNEENRGKSIKWKDLPRGIKIIICSLSVMMVMIYIIVIIAVVITSLPKNEVKGIWTLWSSWSNCDVTCDNGTQTRLRLCYNPFISKEQLVCEGNSTESVQCQQHDCLEGAWSTWGTWGSCSESCGGGLKSRSRTCANPRSSKVGNGCEGSSEKIELCNKNTCDDHKVSFLAFGSTTLTNDTAIQFPSILFNSGAGYNSSTGRFTCNVSGIYNFAVTLTSQYARINPITAYLRINGVSKLNLNTQPYDYHYDAFSYSLSVSGNFYLNTYDYVYVYSVPSNFRNDYSTSFTGVLVVPDN